MFEGVLTSLLNKYLGDFIEGLDAEQLQLGVWGGEIHLTNLAVKPSALSFLHLPVGVRSGTLGGLHVKINWRSLWSQPVEVELEDLYVVACSKDIKTIDEQAEAARALASKLAALKSREEFTLSEAFQAALVGKLVEHKAAAKQGMVGRLIATIVDNIQVAVRNVHVRFEHQGAEDGSNKANVGGHPTALGIVLHSLRVCSTDEAGNERFVAAGPSPTDPSKNRTYKRVELQNMYVYFNTARSGRKATRPATEFDLRAPFDSMNEVGAGHDFLVRPISGQVRLELNKNEPAAGEAPAIRVGVKLQGIELTVDEVQYHALLKVLASISQAATADRIVCQRYADQFRIGTPLEQARYVALYQRCVAPSWEPELDDTERSELEEMDKALSFTDVANYRSMALALLHAQMPDRVLSKRVPHVAPANAGLVKRWVGMGVGLAKAAVGAGGDPNLIDGPDFMLNDEEREEIVREVLEARPPKQEQPLPDMPRQLNEAGEDVQAVSAAALPRSYVSMLLELDQSHLSVSLLNKSRRALLSVVVSHTRVRFEQRQAGAGMLAAVSIGNIALQDQATPNTLYPDIFSMSRAQREKMHSLATSVASSPRSSGEGEQGALSPSPAPPTSPSAPFIDLVYEAVPLDPSVHADARVVVHVLPSLLVVHSKWLARLSAFFATPAADLQRPDQVASMGSWEAATLAQFKASTSASVLAAFESHSSMSIEAHIAMPTVLASVAPNILHSHVLVADLGLLTVHTTTQTKDVIRTLTETIAINTAVQKANQAAAEKAAAASSSAVALSPAEAAALRHAHPPVPLLSANEIRKCYDHIHVRLQNVQAFMSQAQSSVGGRGFDARAVSALLSSPLSVATRVELSIAPQIDWMANMRVDGEIAAVELEVSTSAFHKIMDITKSFSTIGAGSAAAPAAHPSALVVPKSPEPATVTASSKDARLTAAAGSSHAFDRPARSPSLSVSIVDSEMGDFPSSTAAGPRMPSLSEKAFLTFDDLTALFQSEREARLLMSDLDADGNGSVSREEYHTWLMEKKHQRKHKKGMEIEFRIGGIRVTVMDDKRVMPASMMSPSPLSQAIGMHPPPQFRLTPASSPTAASHNPVPAYYPPREVVCVIIGGLLFTQRTHSYSSVLGVEIGSFTLRDCLTPHEGDFRNVLTSRAPASTPSKYLPASTAFLKVKMTSVSAEHPDFGMESLSDVLAAEERELQGAGAVAPASSSSSSPSYISSSPTLLPSQLDVRLGNVVVLVDADAINALAMFFLKDFLPKAELAAANAMGDASEAKQSAAATPAAAAAAVPQSSAAPSPVSQAPASTTTAAAAAANTLMESIPVHARTPPAVAMRITVKLSLFQLMLTHKGRHFCKIATQGLSTTLDMRGAHVGGGMRVNARLSKLAVVDQRGVRPVPVIIGIEPVASHLSARVAAPPCLEASFVMLSPESAAAYGYASHASASLRGLKVVTDFRFVGSVLAWLFATLSLPFIAGDRQQQVASAAASVLEEKVEEKVAEIVGEENAPGAEPSPPGSGSVPFLQFRVEMEDVEVVLPNHTTNDPTHKLTFHIVQMDVHNNVLFARDPLGALVEYQQFAVGLGGASLLSAAFPGPEAGSRASTILHLQEMAIACTMGQAVNSTLDVQIAAQRLDVSLAQENYAFLMDMLAAMLENLAGLSSPPPLPGDESAAAVVPAKAADAAPAAPPAVDASAPAPASSWIRVSLLFHALSIELLKGKGWAATDGLLTVLGQGMDVRYFLDTTGGQGQGVEAAFAALEVLDESCSSAEAAPEVRPEYRRMVAMRNPDTHRSPLEQVYPTAFAASQHPIKRCDLRELVEAHRRPPAPSPVGALFAGWRMAAVTGAMDIDLRLEHLVVCACSMVVMEVGSFFVLPPKPAPDVAEADLTKEAEQKTLYGHGLSSSDLSLDQQREEGVLLMADALLTGALSPKVPPPPPGLVLSVKLAMPQAVVQLLSSVHVPDARTLNLAMDLGVEFGMGNGRMSASVQLDQLRMIEGVGAASEHAGYAALISTPEQEGRMLVLQPVGIHVAFLSEPSRLFPGHSSMTVDVGIAPTMVLNVGYQQYLLLMGAMGVLFPPAPPASALSPNASATPSSPASGTASAKAASDATSPAPSADPPAPAFTPPAALHFSEQNIYVQVNGVQVNLLNDCYAHSLYLLRVGVGNVIAKMHKLGDSGGLYARLDLTAESFNPRVLNWEPIIEPWDCVLSQYATQNTRTPQEYLLLNQPKKKQQLIADDLASESSYGPSGSLDSRSLSVTGGGGGNASYSNVDKSMSPAAIAAALVPFTNLSVSSSRPFNVTLSVAVMSDLIDFVALLPQQVLKPTPAWKVDACPPYRVENHTQLDVEVYLTSTAPLAVAAPSYTIGERRPSTLAFIKNASQKAMSAVGFMEAGSGSTSPGPKVLSPASKAMLRTLAQQRIRVPAYDQVDLEYPDAIPGPQRGLVVQFHATPSSSGGDAPVSPSKLRYGEFTLSVSQNRSVRVDLNSKSSSSAALSDGPVVVVVDMMVKRGVRIISLHSDVAIGNQSDAEIAVRTTLRTEHIVPRGKLFYLPVMAASQRRKVQVRPYEAAAEGEVDLSKVGSERIIQSIDTDTHPPSSSAESSVVSMSSQSAATGLRVQTDLPDPAAPIRAPNPRLMVPHKLNDDRLLYHWSGDLVCDAATHKQMRSDQTGAMHYTCSKRSVKATRRRKSVLAHQGSRLQPPGSEMYGERSSASKSRPSSPGGSGDQATVSPDPEADSSAFNFTVYAAVWKKMEQRQQAEEEHKGAGTGSSSSGANHRSPEPVDSSGDSISYGELQKKKYCSLYYVRSPLTVENFMASSVCVRMYHTDRQRDENLNIVSGVMSPPSSQPKQPEEGHALVNAAQPSKTNLFSTVTNAARLTSAPTGPPRLVEEVTLDRGQAFPSHAVSTHLDTLLSVRVPGLNTDWSEPMRLRLSREPGTVKFHLRDNGSGDASTGVGGMLTVLGEVSVVQGHVHVILYTHYMLFDLTRLGLLLINDENRLPLPRNTSELQEEQRVTVHRSGVKQSKAEDGLLEDRMIERNNAALDLQDEAGMEVSAARADARLAAVLEEDQHRDDVVQPVMFSSKHHQSKKQRVRLIAGWMHEADDDVSSSSSSTALAAPGSLGSNVSHSFLGPTNDPSGHASAVLPSHPNYLVSWSDVSTPFSMEHVGTAESITIPSAYVGGVLRSSGVKLPQLPPGEGMSFEVVCNVSNGPGRFYRTKQVTFAPRFVLVNKLNTPVLVRQYAPPPKAGQPNLSALSVVSIGALETQVFHWPHPVREGRPWVCFKRDAPEYEGWHWTGFVNLTVAGDSPMIVTDARSHQHWFASIDVRMSNSGSGTAFVVIDEFKQQGVLAQVAMDVPFLVQNRSAVHTIRFKQSRDRPELSCQKWSGASTVLSSPTKSTMAAAGSSFVSASPSPASSSSVVSSAGPTDYDWFEIPPRGIMPWVWEEPLQEHKLVVQFGVLSDRGKVIDWQKERKLEFDQEEEGDTTLRNRPSQSTSGSVATAAVTASKIYYHIESSGPTLVMVFADKSHRAKKGNLLTSVLGSSSSNIAEEVEGQGEGDEEKGDNDDDMKEIPDDGGRGGRIGGLSALTAANNGGKDTAMARVSSSHVDPRLPAGEMAEADGGLATFDPASENDEDRKVDDTLSMRSLGAPASHEAAAAARSSSLLPSSQGGSAVPASFTGSGVLHVTVVGASGFKSSRRNMFAGVLFAGMRQRTEVARGQREPKWGKRMIFATELDSDDFEATTCGGCCAATTVGARKKKKQSKPNGSSSVDPADAQVLYVNLYEKTTFSDHFLGAATIRLRDVGFEHTDAWFDVVKQKGGKRGMEKRGRVHLGLWWQQDAAAGQNNIAEEEVLEAGPASPHQPLRLGPGSDGPGLASGAGPAAAAPLTVLSPRLHRMVSTPEHVAQQKDLYMLSLCPAYEECDRSKDRLWSEYRIRVLTTALMKELAAAHGLDFLQGRLVAYITCPLMARPYSVLLMDHGVHNVARKWTQDVRFAIPHALAKKYRKFAVVRITLFFFRAESKVRGGSATSKARENAPAEHAQAQQSEAAAMQDGAADASSAAPASAASSSPASPAPSAVGPFNLSPISGRCSDLYAHPVRVGECQIDLMSVREVSMAIGGTNAGGDEGEVEENEEKQAMADEKVADELDAHAVQQAEAEEEMAAHGKPTTKKKAKKKSKKELQAEERARQRKEWHAKWVPLVSSVKTPPVVSAIVRSASSSSADGSDPAAAAPLPPDASTAPRVPSLCLNIKRTVVERERGRPYRPTATAVKVVFPLIGLSVVDSTPEEVAYFSLTGLALSLNDSAWQTTLSATIQSMQLDNLLSRAAFPVVFNPTILQGASAGPPQPFIQVALNRKKSTIPNLTLFPYFSILVQKMDVRVEEINIWRTLTFVNQMALRMGGDLTKDLAPAGLTRRYASVLDVPAIGTQKLFFKLLHVQPLALNLSFAAQPGQRQATSNYHINPLYTALHMLEAGIGNINDAPLRLNGKLIENALGTSDTIVWSLVQHYIQQGMMEGYKVLGSVEFLGNPVGLASELGTGTLDFFAEPAKGLMISPEAFGSGLAKGSGSLIKGALGGVMSAASAVTNSASKAMATASGDEAFMASQAAGRNAHQPEHVGEGLKMGVQALGSSLVSGVTGVFLDPLAGAKKEGLLGFGKGLAKGIAGVVFKPIAGVLDLTTNTLKGIGNTASYLLDGPLKELRPVRPQRYIPPSGVLLPYDFDLAQAHDMRWQRDQEKDAAAKAGKKSKQAAQAEKGTAEATGSSAAVAAPVQAAPTAAST